MANCKDYQEHRGSLFTGTAPSTGRTIGPTTGAHAGSSSSLSAPAQSKEQPKVGGRTHHHNDQNRAEPMQPLERESMHLEDDLKDK